MTYNLNFLFLVGRIRVVRRCQSHHGRSAGRRRSSSGDPRRFPEPPKPKIFKVGTVVRQRSRNFDAARRRGGVDVGPEVCSRVEGK